MDKLVQGIVISRGGTHEEVVTAVAGASVFAWLNTQTDPVWDQFFDGHFTKLVFRGTQTQFDAMKRYSASSYEFGTVKALGLKPYWKDSAVQTLNEMQVSGLERPRLGFGALEHFKFESIGSSRRRKVYVAINPDLVMSTGKTASQVAHGLLGWAVANPDFKPLHGVTGDSWSVTDNRLAFERLSQAADAGYALRIVDDGLTEIDPDSTTVIAGYLP
jgi:hypothetical protein